MHAATHITSRFLHASLLALTIASLAAPAAADTFWVDGKAGNDMSGDGSQAKPWRTIGFAIATVSTPTPDKDHRIHIVGDQAYDLTAPLVMKYNVRLVGVAVNAQRPRLRGGDALPTLVLFDPNVVYNRKQSGLESLVFEGGQHGATMGGAGGNRHRPEVYYCHFEQQKKAGILIDQRAGQTSCDPRFFHCFFFMMPRGIDATASGNDTVLRPDVEECVFEWLTEDGYRLQDTSSGGSDVGGLVRYCWFWNCGRGVAVVSGLDAFKTRLDVVSSWFHGCQEEGIDFLVSRPADPALTVRRCSFVANRVGLQVRGLFGPGIYHVTVEECVAQGNAHSGFLYWLNRGEHTGKTEVTIVSRQNLAVRNSRGFSVHNGLFGPSVDLLTYQSVQDRALENLEVGAVVTGGDSASTASFDSGIFARNLTYGGISMQSAMRIEARFLTLADNSPTGLKVHVGTPGARAEHCVFANNVISEVDVPMGFPITNSLFQKQSYAGTGNQQADPRLDRPFYKLLAGSPAIDKGDPAATRPDRDYEGDARLVGARPDLGGDEYVAKGSAHTYGQPGYGLTAFHPEIAVPASQDGVRIGSDLSIQLVQAIDYGSRPGLAALLFFGTSEAPTDLVASGGPGSFAWTDGNLGFVYQPIDALGNAMVKVGIPSVPALVGVTFTTQWLVFKPNTSLGSYVTTQGLRATIGS